MKHSKVCVIVPCYNEEKVIGNCLSALKNQTYPNYEILVIDDASTDNTPKIVKDHGVKLIRLEKNRGLARARNVGIQHADAEIIAFTDGDCVVEKRWLEELINTMKSKNLDVVIGKKVKPLNSYCYVVRAQLGRSIKEIRDESLGGGYSVAYKKEVFKELGGFNERFMRGCDFEFHLRVMESRFNLGWAKDAVVGFSYPDTVRKIWKQQSADGFWIKEIIRVHPWFIRRQIKFLAARVLIVVNPLPYVLWTLKLRKKYDNLKMMLDHCVFIYLRSLAYCIGFLSPRPARYLKDDR